MPPRTTVNPSGATVALLARLLSDDRGWESEFHGDAESLIAQAIDHGVDALVWDAVGTAAGAPHEIRSRLDDRVRAAATRDLFVQRDLRAALDAMAASGVNALLIKGAALAYTVYAKPWQ